MLSAPPASALLSALSTDARKGDLVQFAKSIGVRPKRRSKSALAREVARRVLLGGPDRVARIFADPLVEEIRFGAHGRDALFAIAARIATAAGLEGLESPGKVRAEVVRRLNKHDVAHWHERAPLAWIEPEGYERTASLSDLRRVARTAPGDEVTLRRLQQILGVRLVAFSEDYSRVHFSDYGGPFERGAAFLVYDAPQRAWGAIAVAGEILQAPEALAGRAGPLLRTYEEARFFSRPRSRPSPK